MLVYGDAQESLHVLGDLHMDMDLAILHASPIPNHALAPSSCISDVSTLFVDLANSEITNLHATWE